MSAKSAGTRTRVSPRARLPVALAAAALLGAAAPTAYATLADGAPPPAASPAGARPFVETRLLFGTERPDGGPAVTDRQFMAFVDHEVTPRFPDGLTVQEGRGQWRGASGAIVRERSYELILLYPSSEAEAARARIERIRGVYTDMFAQESVARVDDRVRVAF
ncbi:DUF3574 domain-containing protein [Streptomyces sp. MUM 203J]|uniref:DUF3574 domain-containing protein n=1 Tax=Streptomyces sp. MUM 203J TaxID=2791990 RepID=UPI001F0385C2|nr:DUF3574 domain-containing protein [Streptomyces sp. MUM 203J]MCH0539507.1 DUF3574 domain-containing protein [Streptomyces sp. MUM 203J]